MRVGIQGWGSEGDLRPLLALAIQLRRRGHEVRLVLSPIDGHNYGAACREHGVELRIVPDKMEYSLRDIQGASRSKDFNSLSVEMM